ncbi:MAG TPA: hypothetical protein VD998_01570 [Verrucomicrobiae bacterium]|nr:hypothetical protein [Verrucomicrobiae bacterium]
MDEHYVCMGSCSTVSDKPQKCGNPDCTKHGEEFVSCSCTDGNHDEAHKKTDTSVL